MDTKELREILTSTGAFSPELIQARRAFWEEQFKSAEFLECVKIIKNNLRGADPFPLMAALMAAAVCIGRGTAVESGLLTMLTSLIAAASSQEQCLLCYPPTSEEPDA